MALDDPTVVDIMVPLNGSDLHIAEVRIEIWVIRNANPYVNVLPEPSAAAAFGVIAAGVLLRRARP